MFEQIAKDFEVRQKYSATRRIFNPLLGAWICGQPRYIVFHMLRPAVLKPLEI